LPADPAARRQGDEAARALRGAGRRSEGRRPDTELLEARLAAVTIRDRVRLGARIGRLGPGSPPERVERLLADLDAAEARLARRAGSVPEVSYPPELPVSARRAELLEALAAHQVVVVAGETGSGKTTQLPKLCLELGRGVAGMIGHTQPRRIAARTVAARLAEELGVALGGPVGYAVRFADRVGEDTLVKVMTDGLLLAELPRDPLLSRYDTIIVDEAHERSLSIDFLLGYLKRLLPARADLQVIVTSATIDTARIAAHFGGAPVVEVSGRAHPVEIRWRPPGAPDGETEAAAPLDETDALVEAVLECVRSGPGDVLVFLVGEREIRDAADALTAVLPDGVEVLPLYARLSAAAQYRVFEAHTARRVVLATNVAETSLTVPGIRFVVDPGRARVSRYDSRAKVQSLPIEPISRASADQRAGRCGRTGPGVCIRLYSEEDYAGRPEFTSAEILRTNLASVVLRMADLGLGGIESFPFPDPPERRSVRAALALLDELGALAGVGADGPQLSAVGRLMARLPVDPRLARMIVEATRLGCVREVTVIVAALSIADPREWPAEERQAASAAHARFVQPGSDFLGLLELWRYLQRAARESSSSAFRRRCRREYLNYQRVREWEDLCTQLRQASREAGLRPAGRAPASDDAIHQALLAGLLSHVGRLEEEPARRAGASASPGRNRRRARTYLGARSTRFSLAAGSALVSAPPRFVMAAELVETDRLRARTAAAVEPAWAEQLGAHLVTRDYDEPHWDRRRAAALVRERVSLYGVPLVEHRSVGLAAIDLPAARELFLRHALVEGDWDGAPELLAHNRRAREAVFEMEHRLRRRPLLADDDTLARLYDERVPAGIATGRSFERWWRDERTLHPELLALSPADLVDPGLGPLDLSGYPDLWHLPGLDGGAELAVTYRYEPGADDDGVSVHVPLGLLLRLQAQPFDWQVPGRRAELVAALLRCLPPALRRATFPAAGTARAFLDQAGPEDGPLLDVLAGWVARRAGEPLTARAWRVEELPEHLRVRFSVEDATGRCLASSRDLPALQARLRTPLRDAAAAASGLERPPAARWEWATLPSRQEVSVAGHLVAVYPGLLATGSGVAVRVFLDPEERDEALVVATRALLLLGTNPPVARAARSLPRPLVSALAHVPHASLAAFLEDCAAAAVDLLVADAGGGVLDEAGWAELHTRVAAGLPEATERVVTRAALAVSWAHAVRSRLAAVRSPALATAASDVSEQLDRLVGPGFVAAAGAARLVDVVRYVRAAERRLDRLVGQVGQVGQVGRDARNLGIVRSLETALDETVGRWSSRRVPEVDELRWMIEELRVVLWAPELAAPGAPSEARIRRAIARLDRPGSRSAPALPA